MLSGESRAEIVGPLAWGGRSVADWLREYAVADAGTLGQVLPSTGETVSTATISGQSMTVAALSVNVAGATRYISYSAPTSAVPASPIMVIRSSFADALTMVRAFRGSVEALLPYVLLPTNQMRALAVTATAPPAPTSFRVPVVATSDTVATNAASREGSDSALVGFVRATVTDAITLYGDGSVNPPAAAPRRTSAISEANIDAVVFYQWGDLEYHPVVLFRDGTALDIGRDAVDDIDVSRSRASSPADWGKWRRDGLKYVLTSGGNGRPSAWTLGEGLYPAFAAPAAATLSGRYKSVSGSSMGETATLLTSTYTFGSDGRFTEGTDFAATGSGAVSGVTMAGGASSARTGRYRLTRYSIELVYDSGKRARYFFTFGSTGEPLQLTREMLFLGNTAYVLESPA